MQYVLFAPQSFRVSPFTYPVLKKKLTLVSEVEHTFLAEHHEERFIWKAGYPRSGTSTLPSLPLTFLLGLLTFILSVRAAILLGQTKWDCCRNGGKETEGPPRRSRGHHLILAHYGQRRPKVRSAPSIVWTEEKFAHTSSVYFLLDLVYWVLIYDKWTTGCRCGCKSDLKQYKGTSFLSPIHMKMKEFVWTHL